MNLVLDTTGEGISVLKCPIDKGPPFCACNTSCATQKWLFLGSVCGSLLYVGEQETCFIHESGCQLFRTIIMCFIEWFHKGLLWQKYNGIVDMATSRTSNVKNDSHICIWMGRPQAAAISFPLESPWPFLSSFFAPTHTCLLLFLIYSEAALKRKETIMPPRISHCHQRHP